MKVTYRAQRYSKDGPGWYSICATGAGGADFLEVALTSLLMWRPDFDIDAVKLPELTSDFPLQDVKDALGNVKEQWLVPGVTLIDADAMTIRVAAYGRDVLILRSAKRRRVTLTPAPPPPPPAPPAPSPTPSDPPAPPPAPAPPAPPAPAPPAPPPAPPAPSPPPQPAASSQQAVSSQALVPFAGVTASGLEVIRKTNFKIPTIKLPALEQKLRAIPPEELPPFYDESLKQLELLRQQQDLTTSLGVERVKLTHVTELADPSVKVAFCTTALRRPTVAMALIINLSLTWHRRDNITWHVVDFNEDMELTETLTKVLEAAIRCGHLKLYRSSELKYWHACIAKNTAHMVVDESFDVLCNVDGDNLLTLGFVEHCLTMAGRMKSGEVGCTHFYGSGEAGTYGRIMITRNLFHKLGGYDEEFHPVGCQDTDLIYRVLCCKNVGTIVRVCINNQVGTSIDNRPGATWSDCIKEKVSNTDPSKYSRWKFGYMDQVNRTRMYELLEQGIVQRNVDKQIGVSTSLIELTAGGVTPEDPSPPGTPKSDVDWSPSPERRPVIKDVPPNKAPEPASGSGGASSSAGAAGSGGASSSAGAAGSSPAAASGGVTPKAAGSGDAPMKQFRIATWGVQKLSHAFDGKNNAANDMLDAWEPTRGGPPQPVDLALINNALMDVWGVPDVVIDARAFRPPKIKRHGHHIGHSLKLSWQLVNTQPTFGEMFKESLVLINEIHAARVNNMRTKGTGGVTPVNITVFCRAGEKRSVSIAWMLSEALKQHAGWQEAEPINHLCSRFWARKTCGGRDCAECDLTDDGHQDLVQSLEGMMA